MFREISMFSKFFLVCSQEFVHRNLKKVRKKKREFVNKKP